MFEGGEYNREKSSCTFTLKEVNQKSGALFGNITGSLSLYLKQMGQLKLKDAILLQATFDMEVCIDGTLPDREIKTEMSLKGKSRIDSPPEEGELTINMNMSGTRVFTKKRMALKDK